MATITLQPDLAEQVAQTVQLSAVWVVGDELGNEVVLGRNVLNRLRLLLDGPAAMTEVWDEF
jgi:hypothetical protein